MKKNEVIALKTIHQAWANRILLNWNFTDEEKYYYSQSELIAKRVEFKKKRNNQ